MARKARSEAAGALHDPIVPGIEREEIFKDDEERNCFIGRGRMRLIPVQTMQSGLTAAMVIFFRTAAGPSFKAASLSRLNSPI